MPALVFRSLHLIRTACNFVVAGSKSQNSDGEGIIEGQGPSPELSLVQKHSKPRLGIEGRGHKRERKQEMAKGNLSGWDYFEG